MQRPKCPPSSPTLCVHRDVSTPPPKTQPAKTWCLSKNQHMFALRKRNAWRHLPECHHQAKSNPRLNEKQTYWRSHFLHKVPFHDEQSSPVTGKTHWSFQLEPLLLTMAFLPMHCCKNSYYCSELIQMCSPPQSGSCWLLQLLHFWSPALTAVLQGVGTARRKLIKI